MLAFFPGAFTSVCTTEMCALRDRVDQLGALNAEVVGVTVDPPFVLDAWKAAHGVGYTFLSDYNREVSARLRRRRFPTWAACRATSPPTAP